MSNWLFPSIFCAICLPTHAAVTIDWAVVGNPGNEAQSPANRKHDNGSGDGWGSVPYSFSISRYEITIAQYTAFLNAVAASDPYDVYDQGMTSIGAVGGILRSGTAGNYTYSVVGNGEIPISFVNWLDAARFANWIHNGQITGMGAEASTETGAHQLLGVKSIGGSHISLNLLKSAEAMVWVPSADEWYKAASYDPRTGEYAVFANGRNSIDVSEANFSGGGPTSVGLFNSPSSYGTYDQTGNVSELMSGRPNVCELRGGSWLYGSPFGSHFSISMHWCDGQDSSTGFRLAGLPVQSLRMLRSDGGEIVNGGLVGGFSTVHQTELIMVKNENAQPWTGLAWTISGPQASEFSIGGGMPTELAPGASAEFQIVFAPTATGTRSATMRIASSNQALNASVLRLVGARSNPSELWRFAQFGSTANSGDGADFSDPDGDGFSNLMEYAMGSDPKGFTVRDDEVIKNGNVLEYRYWRSKAAVSEVSFVREFASGPNGPWQQTGGAVETILSDNGVRQRVQVNTPASTSVERRFVRLRITRR